MVAPLLARMPRDVVRVLEDPGTPSPLRVVAAAIVREESGLERVYDTHAEAVVAVANEAAIPASIRYVSTRGYYASGDGGGARYRRSSGITHGLKLGTTFEIDEQVVYSKQAGCRVDLTEHGDPALATDDKEAFRLLCAYAAITGKRIALSRGGMVLTSTGGPIIIPVNTPAFHLEGINARSTFILLRGVHADYVMKFLDRLGIVAFGTSNAFQEDGSSLPKPAGMRRLVLKNFGVSGSGTNVVGTGDAQKGIAFVSRHDTVLIDHVEFTDINGTALYCGLPNTGGVHGEGGTSGISFFRESDLVFPKMMRCGSTTEPAAVFRGNAGTDDPTGAAGPNQLNIFGIECSGARNEALVFLNTSGRVGSAINIIRPKLHGFPPSRNNRTTAISGITKAANGVVTLATTPTLALRDGESMLITGVVGMTEINDQVVNINLLTPTTFETGVNTSAYGAYISGGTAAGYTRPPPHTKVALKFEGEFINLSIIAPHILNTQADPAVQAVQFIGYDGRFPRYVKMVAARVTGTSGILIEGGASYDFDFVALGRTANGEDEDSGVDETGHALTLGDDITGPVTIRFSNHETNQTYNISATARPWFKRIMEDRVHTISNDGNANHNVQTDASTVVLHSGVTLTNNRNLTLLIQGACENDVVRVIRRSAGAFNLTVRSPITASIVDLATNTEADFQFTAGDWILLAKRTIS